MKGSSKVIMGATLVMVASLAVVLGLVLVLLAELYCSLLLRRRPQRMATTAPAASSPANEPPSQIQIQQQVHHHHDHSSSASPLGSFYLNGVLTPPPRGFLFHVKQDQNQKKLLHVELEKQHSPATTLHSFGVVSASPLSPAEIVALRGGGGGCGGGEHFVSISNPIYDNSVAGRLDTPFQTPDTSPSRLENGSSSGEDDIDQSPTSTPPLTPMKKLPESACSVSLRDARALATSGSDSNSNNNNNAVSSSSSGSPCTSPSW
ncbi:uncharacterized protein LOC127795535 [Diospyros lotus]|uniref:uncharacterized protein LOC127795535 n=1 Tax=Diospyros lotus TaxID=55363 RepID=UPI002256CCF6|nr:uncharacterized protein LOC127795535 [Diospyros lotus]